MASATVSSDNENDKPVLTLQNLILIAFQKMQLSFNRLRQNTHQFKN
jgi:hypothetical protein